jgi:uncharacterized short protein YbdD (DUF466 family)
VSYRICSTGPPARRAPPAIGARTARLMIGVPDYDTYVAHRQAKHPDQPIMTYVEFFRERQDGRYAIGKGCFRACC